MVRQVLCCGIVIPTHPFLFLVDSSVTSLVIGRSRLYAALICISLVGLVCIYMYRGLLKDVSMHWHSRKYQRVTPYLNELASRGRRRLTLWDFAGCDTEHPILLCSPKRKVKRKLFYTVAKKSDFERNVYLNSSRHASCSLVGNSGNLKTHSYGKRIDHNRIVIRINNPPIKGYQKFVGKRRADIMIINNHLTEDRCIVRTENRSLYVLSSTGPLTGETESLRNCHFHETGYLYRMSNFIEKGVSVVLQAYAEANNFTRTPEGKRTFHATSGLKSLFFCMLICKEVRVFGFGMEGAKTWHYFGKEVYQPLHHEMSLEMEIMRDIVSGTFNYSILRLDRRFVGTVRLY